MSASQFLIDTSALARCLRKDAERFGWGRAAEAAAAVSCGQSRFPADVSATVVRQSERDKLTELIGSAEAEHGPIADEETQGLREQLHWARERQMAGELGE